MTDQVATPQPPKPATSIVAAVNAGAARAVPKGFSAGNTNDKNENFLHCLLYGEVDSRKTTTAAMFGGPEKTFIIQTRSAEQLTPLQGLGFRYALVKDADALRFALQFPEKAADAIGWPEWKDLEGRVLLTDDMTEGANFLVEDNETNDKGEERKDGRQIYKAVNSDIRELMSSLLRKPMHVLMTALARVDLSPIANEETIYPEMPKGARSQIMAGLEYVFYMKKSTHKMLTTTSFLQYTKKNEFGKDVAGRREIFARNKLPRELAMKTPPFLLLEEPQDLRALWKKIQDARGVK